MAKGAEGQASNLTLTNLVQREHLADLVLHFAGATGVASAIVLVPSAARKESVRHHYAACLGDTPSAARLPRDFTRSLIRMDRITRILPRCREFCKLVRRSAIGDLRCWWSDVRHCGQAFDAGQVRPYECHMGIKDVVAPIRVGGRHVANVYAGQVWTEIHESILRRQFNNLKLRRYGITFDRFSAARDKLPHLTDAQLEQAKQLLADLAELISERATAEATLRVLKDIGSEIGSADLRQGLLSFLHHARRLLNCNTGSVWLLDQETREAHPAAIDWALAPNAKQREGQLYNLSIPEGQGLIGHVISQGREVVAEAAAEIAEIPPALEDSRTIRALKSFLGVPMLLGGAVIGVFEVGSSVEHALRRRDVSLVTTLAAHAGAFTQTAAVTALLRDIIAATGIRQLVSLVVRTLPSLVCGKGCSLFLRQRPGEGDAYLVASHGLAQELVVDVGDFVSGSPDLKGKAFYKPREGLTGWVLNTGQMLNLTLHESAQRREKAVAALSRGFVKKGLPPVTWASKYREDSAAKGSSAPTKDDFARKAWIGVPLLTENDKVCGVLRISERWMGNFTVQECRILEACAKRISLAIAKESTVLGFVAGLAAAIDAKDPYTERHSHNVRKLSLAIGKELGLLDTELRELEMAALLHDIGKIGIPDAILSKAGLLNWAEKKAMDMHPVIGDEILGTIHGMDRIRLAVVQHHERVDGSGLPRRLIGEQMDLYAKIIGLADSYDAMRGQRPYKQPMQPSAARAEIERCAGKQFDGKVVDAFLRIVPDY